jgi:hypothetical protein
LPVTIAGLRCLRIDTLAIRGAGPNTFGVRELQHGDIHLATPKGPMFNFD